MRLAITIFLGVLGVASGMYALAAAELAVRFRTDIPKGALPSQGKSWAAAVNVLDPRNYSREGRGAYWRLVVAQLVGIAALLGCLSRIPI